MTAPFPWSDETRARAKHLYLVDGLSAGLVSEAMAKEFKRPLSRSAVIGLLYRMGVKRGEAAKPRVEKERIMPKRKARPLPPPGSSSMVAGQPVTPKKGSSAKKKNGQPAFSQLTGLRVVAEVKPGYFPPEPVAREPLRVTLMELESHSCRWPVTPAAPFFFCGHRAEAGGPYCRDHMAARVARDQRRAVKGLESYAKLYGGGG